MTEDESNILELVDIGLSLELVMDIGAKKRKRIIGVLHAGEDDSACAITVHFDDLPIMTHIKDTLADIARGL